MRRRIPYRVCRCMPNGVVTQMETRLLKELVNREIHPIRCAKSSRRKFMKGLRIGELCFETGHLWWALRIWKLTAWLIESKDWDDWLYVHFNNEWESLTDVISEAECEELLKRCGKLYQALGFPEEYWWTEEKEHFANRYFGFQYYELFAEKHYGYYFFDLDYVGYETEMSEIRDEQETDMLFRDGQGDCQPMCAQDFFEYWQGSSQGETFAWLDN